MYLNKVKLRDLTFRKGLNQRGIARKTKLSYVVINGIYNGRATTEETAQKIAEVLEIPLESITVKP